MINCQFDILSTLLHQSALKLTHCLIFTANILSIMSFIIQKQLFATLIIIPFQKVKMLPFDKQIQALNSSESTNQFTHNMSTSFAFPNPSFSWNMEYSKSESHHYFTANNYAFMPHSELQGLEELKYNNQPTRPSQNAEVAQTFLKDEKIQTEEKIVVQKHLELKFQQKYGRNILSNIFNMTIKKILSPEFSKIIQKAIQVNNMTISLHQFRERLQEKTKPMKGYINMKAIKALQIGKPIGATKLDIEFRRLLRILCRIYNHNYHLPHVYHTGKIKIQSRRLHLECLRKLSNKNKK